LRHWQSRKKRAEQGNLYSDEFRKEGEERTEKGGLVGKRSMQEERGKWQLTRKKKILETFGQAKEEEREKKKHRGRTKEKKKNREQRGVGRGG